MFLLIILILMDQVMPNQSHDQETSRYNPMIDQGRLQDMLFNESTYNKRLKPVTTNHPVNINVSFSLYQIVSVDQKRNLIIVSAYFDLSWIDEYLTWEPSDYDGIKVVYMPANKIWKPELYLYYSVDEGQTLSMESDIDVQIWNNGKVRYFVPFTANSLCPINVKYFPFDNQTCVMLFGAWSHSTSSIIYTPTAEDVYLGDFYDNQEWILDNATLIPHYQFYDNSNYSAFKITLKVRRQPFYYVFNLVGPSALITGVALVGFHFPNASTGSRPSKFRLGIMTLLSMAVLLLSVVTDMPKFSFKAEEGKRGSFSSIPLIAIFYFSLLSIVSLSTITTSMLVVLERFVLSRKPRLPICFRWLIQIPCMGPHSMSPLRLAKKERAKQARRSKNIQIALMNQRDSTSLSCLNHNLHVSPPPHNCLDSSGQVIHAFPNSSPRPVATFNSDTGTINCCSRHITSCQSVPPFPLTFDSSPVIQELRSSLFSLVRIVSELNDSFTKITSKAEENINVIEWQMLLHRIEVSSAITYITSTFLALYFFFNYDWY